MPADIASAAAETAGDDRCKVPLTAPVVLLDDNLTPGGVCTLFTEPVEIVRCDDPADVGTALDAIARASARGLFAAGFLSYELGYLLEPKLAPLLPADRTHPLLWMGLFERPHIMDRSVARGLIEDQARANHHIENLRADITRDTYLADVRRVKDYIAAGDVYQINLTFKYLFELTGDSLSLYAELRRKQRVAHGALIRTGEFDVLSLSPELFLSVAGGEALAKPMKGTAARAPTPEADAARRDWLRHDEKSRAENLMIVDLLRNDLGRVAAPGSVEVPKLFTVETYPTVHQMTSSVRARLRPNVGADDIIRALFPCGSITGAPKVRAMEIIRELEPRPRGVYTGAIGMIAPNGDLSFNVAIRTLAIAPDGRAQMGIGSGIVYDSDPEAEFDECLLKARFLTEPFVPFRLIETFRWTRAEGYYLLDLHLDRLEASAAHFGFTCRRARVRAALESYGAGLSDPVARVRLLLDEDGAVEIAHGTISAPDPEAVMRYALSHRPIDRADPFFYHKTTRRTFYESELARLQAETGCDEVILVNDRGELTEGSRTNLFVERGGRLATPPVACGLLGGTLRRALLEDPGIDIEERPVTPADLAAAHRVYLGNSVRGLVRALPVEGTSGASHRP